MKDQKLNFHVIVIGKWKTFTEKNITKNLKDIFTFKYFVSYSKLYKEVYDSDYIIINLDPKSLDDIQFKKIRVTGSAQLAYGFIKPVLIHEDFADFYSFNSTNSFIYGNSNFTQVMKTAIKLDNKNYKVMQENMLSLSKEIYMKSLINIKSSFKNLKFSV